VWYQVDGIRSMKRREFIPFSTAGLLEAGMAGKDY
jgi:hypothetical protein